MDNGLQDVAAPFIFANNAAPAAHPAKGALDVPVLWRHLEPDPLVAPAGDLKDEVLVGGNIHRMACDHPNRPSAPLYQGRYFGPAVSQCQDRTRPGAPQKAKPHRTLLRAPKNQPRRRNTQSAARRSKHAILLCSECFVSSLLPNGWVDTSTSLRINQPVCAGSAIRSSGTIYIS